MARTFAQMQDEVLHDEFDQSKYRELVKRWLNEGAQELVARIELPAQQQKVTVTINAASVPLPANVRVVESITLSDGTRLDEEGWREIDEYPTSTGKPRVFALYGPTLEVWPTPDTSYDATIRAYVSLTAMAGDGDAANVPEEAEDALIHYARSRAFAMEDDFEAAQFEQGLWEQAIVQLRTAVQTRSRGRIRQIPGMVTRPASPRFLRP